MRRLFLILALTVGVATAQNATPAPLNGIWKLTGITATGPSRLLMPGGQLVIAGDSVRGTFGCARFEGRIQAARNAVHVTAHTVARPGGPVCRFAVRGNGIADLNGADRYVLNADHLILFSKTSRLAFERIGFVTPLKR